MKPSTIIAADNRERIEYSVKSYYSRKTRIKEAPNRCRARLDTGVVEASRV